MHEGVSHGACWPEDEGGGGIVNYGKQEELEDDEERWVHGCGFH